MWFPGINHAPGQGESALAEFILGSWNDGAADRRMGRGTQVRLSVEKGHRSGRASRDSGRVPCIAPVLALR